MKHSDEVPKRSSQDWGDAEPAGASNSFSNASKPAWGAAKQAWQSGKDKHKSDRGHETSDRGAPEEEEEEIDQTLIMKQLAAQKKKERLEEEQRMETERKARVQARLEAVERKIQEKKMKELAAKGAMPFTESGLSPRTGPSDHMDWRSRGPGSPRSPVHRGAPHSPHHGSPRQPVHRGVRSPRSPFRRKNVSTSTH